MNAKSSGKPGGNANVHVYLYGERDRSTRQLNQVLYAMGSGFVAIIEHAGSWKPGQDPEKIPAATGGNKKVSPKK